MYIDVAKNDLVDISIIIASIVVFSFRHVHTIWYIVVLNYDQVDQNKRKSRNKFDGSYTILILIIEM